MNFPCGKEVRELKFTYSTIRQMEKRAGASLFHMCSEERMGLDTIAWLVWAGLVHTDARLSPEQVTRWIEEYLEEGEFSTLLVLLFGELQKVKWLKVQFNPGNFQAEAANPTSAQ